MTETEFWTIIERSRIGTDGDRSKQETNLRRDLKTFSPDEIVQFDECFVRFVRAAYHWDLWGAACVISGGCSDDGFWDFRSWLVAQGERVYKSAVEDPQSLAKFVDKNHPRRQWLNFLNPAMFVWGESLGKDECGLDEFPSTVGSNLGEAPEGIKFDDAKEALQERYPLLWEKFGW